MSRTLSELSRLIDELICFGIIAEVDHAGQRLRLDLHGRRSGWLPYPNEIGRNFCRWRPLRVGTQVLAACPSGNPANAVIIAIIPTDALPPPSTAEGLDRVAFNDGSLVEYDSDAKRMHVVSVGDIVAEASGDITASAGGNAAITAGASATISAPTIGLTATQGGDGAATMDGSFRLKGKLEVIGDIAVTGNIAASGSILAGGANSNHHSHP